jgi:dTDP-4-dehydrorhamnose reductase
MLRLAKERDEIEVVDDQTGSPTWSADLSRAIEALLAKGCRGTYHAANSGHCSWNEFARAIYSESGLKTRVNPMKTAELSRPARRPLYSTLDCGRLARDTGLILPPWRDALRGYLALRQKSKL